MLNIYKFCLKGGGSGLNLGKAKVKSMIESFGGRVTSAVSGKTDYVVIGKQPGQSKVGQAQSRGLSLLQLRTVRNLLVGDIQFESVASLPPPSIESFSKGWIKVLGIE